MNLTARVSRIEEKTGSNDPYADLTDEQLEAAIAALKDSIEQATGMSERGYADFLSARIVDGTSSDFVEPDLAHRYIVAIMNAVNGRTRTL